MKKKFNRMVMSSVQLFQQLTLILVFCALKMVTMDSFLKTIASLNSYRNARITTTLNLLINWTLHILYNISCWHLRILAPLDFGAPKKLSLGALAPLPGHHATAF